MISLHASLLLILYSAFNNHHVIQNPEYHRISICIESNKNCLKPKCHPSSNVCLDLLVRWRQQDLMAKIMSEYLHIRLIINHLKIQMGTSFKIGRLFMTTNDMINANFYLNSFQFVCKLHWRIWKCFNQHTPKKSTKNIVNISGWLTTIFITFKLRIKWG